MTATANEKDAPRDIADLTGEGHDTFFKFKYSVSKTRPNLTKFGGIIGINKLGLSSAKLRKSFAEQSYD